MTTRREFLQRAAIGALVGPITGVAAEDMGSAGHPIRTTHRRDQSSKVRLRLVRREETTLRLGGRGDNYHMTWGADDCQFVAVCDGTGWFQNATEPFNSRLFAISGEPQRPAFHDVPGYPELKAVSKTEFENRYYGFGTLAVEGRIYQFLSTPNHRFFQSDGSVWPGARFVGAKLIYSPDNGRTWCNQDGSTPVVWERWSQRSRDNMIFFEEPQDAFSLLSILQMGRSYQANRDGYVYVYAPNGSTDGTMNQLVMFRAPKGKVLVRESYEYFAGHGRDGEALWTKDLGAREVVQTFPRGWVNSSYHPWAWMPSVTYNAPLDLYLMASWGTKSGADGLWFQGPSYLGFWAASKPWGPWAQIHEETEWMPAGERRACAFSPQISPKWIAADGKSFWLAWSDIQIVDEAGARQIEQEMKQILQPTAQDQLRWNSQWQRVRPYYALNVQRVDITMV